MSNAEPGKVYLVGAGPGDPELLTLKAARLLADAGVVLHDDLVPQSILDMAGKQDALRVEPIQNVLKPLAFLADPIGRVNRQVVNENSG